MSYDLRLPKYDKKFNNKEYFEKMKNGDMNARNAIIEHNIRIALQIANTYKPTADITCEDIGDAALSGLIRAVDNFDVGKNCSFTTFAVPCIKHEIGILMRKKSKLEVYSLYEPAYNNSSTDDRLDTLLDTLIDEDAENAFLKLETMLDVKNLSSEVEGILTEKQKLVLSLMFDVDNGIYRSGTEVSELINIATSNVSNILKNALKSIRGYLKTKYNIQINETKDMHSQSLIIERRNYILSFGTKLKYILDNAEYEYLTQRFGLEDGKIKSLAEAGALVGGISKTSAFKLEKKCFEKLDKVKDMEAKEESV